MSAATDGPTRWIVQELEGTSPITLILTGGLIPEVGADFPSESRGSAYMPLGAKEGYSTVTGMTWDKTEMTCQWDAAFMRGDQMTALGLDLTRTPEGLLDAFVTLQERGRECLVQLAGFSRRGILRKVSPKPGRGYNVDVATGAAGFVHGVNLEVSLSWEWVGRGARPVAPKAKVRGDELAGRLSGVNAKLGAGLADSDAFAPDFLSSLKGGIGRMRAGVAKLRKALQGIGDLVNAPARLANEALAAAHSLGQISTDVQNLLSDTTDAYKTLGPAARGAATAVGFGAQVGATKAHELAMKRAAARSREAIQDAQSIVADMFDALESRKPQTVGVRAGQSLSDLARQHLGSADRWPEIAAANQITGQVVPKGTYQLEIPARGR